MKKILSQLTAKKWIKILLGFVVAAGVGYLIYRFAGDIYSAFADNHTTPPATPPATPADDSATKTVRDQATGIFPALSQGAGTVVSGLATLLLKLLAGILWFVLYWMGDLMDNTFILEGEIGEKLRSVWVIVRNFVNIFFALVLVVAALMSVIGYGDESGNYAMKKFIPKMALALIAVNFTFLACRIVLDVNNVLTTAIFSIPQSVTNLSDIGPSGASGVRIFKKFKCLEDKNFQAETTRITELERTNPGVIASLGGVCFAIQPTGALNEGNDFTDDNGQQIIDLDSSQFTKKDFVWTMATQFQGLHNLNKVSQLIEPNFTGLTVNALFSIIFAVIYGAAYVAMFIILLARMVVLWITIMLSPLAAIAIVIPDLLPEDLNIQKKFLDHAFVPAKMAVPISFGYILISQMNVAIDTNSAIVQDKTLDLSHSGEFAREVSITSLMYGAASIAVIWMGVFAASKDVVGSEFVNSWIKEPLQKAGSTVAKWPTYLPIIPVSGGVSLQTLSTGVETLKTSMAEQTRRRDEERLKPYLESMGIITPETQNIMDEIKRARDTNNITINTLNKTKDLSAGQFERTVKDLAVATNLNPAQQDMIARALGAGTWENFKTKADSSAGRTEMQEHVKSSAPQVGSGGGAADYSAAAAIPLSGIKGSISADANLKDLSSEIRGSMGINTEGTSIDMDQGGGLIGFMNTLNNSSKINNPAFKSIVKSDVPLNLAKKDTAIRDSLANDAPFLARLRSNLSDDTEANKKIRELYMVILGITDVAVLNERVEIFKKVDANGTYTA